MDIVILDLEWNAAYSRKLKGYINEIIEFGAVKCDEQLHITSTFSSFVKLQVGKKLTSIVTELTSIKDENLSDAKQFMQVSSRFKKWAGNSLILTWGTSDILTLIENFRYFGGDGQIPFLTRYLDLQRYCEHALNSGGKEQMGLSTAADILHIDVSEIEHHRAFDDSRLSLEILKRLYPQNPLSPFVEDATNEEFYKKMTFKTAIISDIDHPLVTKKCLHFLCEKCGGETERLAKWQFKNKRFVSDFRCISCGYSFSGRIQLKEKYEGIVVNKKCVSLPKIEKPRAAREAVIGQMKLRIKNGVGLLSFLSWEGYGGISHAFSTRIGGVSCGQFAAMNLGLGRGDRDANVLENFRRITAALGIDKDLLVAGAQDHHTNIRRVGHENAGTGIYRPKDMESIDGLCTNEPGVTLVIYAADCVPLYCYDPEKKVIGLAHAGWRGTVNGMARALVEKLESEFACDPRNLVTAIGPSIDQEGFEVDPPCAAEFLKLPNSDFFVRAAEKEKYHVDLWECNRRYLLDAGVLPEHITIGGVSTTENSDLIFSHRITQGQRGSNAAFLTLL